MEVSSSQLVPGEVKRPAPHQPPGVAKNDVSMWIGNVVGADDFARPTKPSSGRGLRVVLVLLLVVVAGGAAGYYLFWKDKTTPSAAPSPATPPQTPPAPMPAEAPVDAMVATPADAGMDAGAGLEVDAISGLPEKPPPAKKKVTKKVTKKPVVKKKPAPRR
jgi:hypothetical protein